jgi:hypothetical protein
MVASDGAGSATRSGESSALACDNFVREVKRHFECGGNVKGIDKNFAIGWLTSFQSELRLRSEPDGLTIRDFACTLLAAVVGTEHSAFVQIGDGVIVVPSREIPDGYHYVFWPQNGEYANQTSFATDEDATAKVLHELDSRRINELAILTDGIQGLALNYAAMSIHGPFFVPMFSWLRTSQEKDISEISRTITTFLNSERVNNRTNDDKTLMLAVRRVSSAPQSSNGASTIQ